MGLVGCNNEIGTGDKKSAVDETSETRIVTDVTDAEVELPNNESSKLMEISE